MKNLFVLLLISLSAYPGHSPIEIRITRYAKKSFKALSKAELTRHLPCDPTFISRRASERGFAKFMSTTYGPYEFSRSDLGESEGWLIIKKDQKETCRIELSLTKDIYFSGQNRVLILKGDSPHVEAFDLSQNCQYLGYLSYELPNEKIDSEVPRLLESNDGSRVCKNEIKKAL